MGVYILDHPLLKHKLSVMRDKRVGTKEFRELIKETAMLMIYDVTRDMPLTEIGIDTPIKNTRVPFIDSSDVPILVPILRAGLGMLDGALALLPRAKVGFIGLYRDDESLEPVEYFYNLPENSEDRTVILLDPMLATGGSAKGAISLLVRHGFKRVKLVNILAAPEGVRAVAEAYPDVDLYVSAVDEGLNDKGYIVPGLGDAGDRLYGTE